MSRLYVPLGIEVFVIACFKVTESNSILYRRYKTIEGLQKGIYDAIMKGADYISLRIIKENELTIKARNDVIKVLEEETTP